MKRSRFSEEQIMGILKEHWAGLGAKELCRKHGVSDATVYKWRSNYGGMEVSDARRLKTLESENAKLRSWRDQKRLQWGVFHEQRWLSR
jgi:putative transposase